VTGAGNLDPRRLHAEMTARESAAVARVDIGPIADTLLFVIARKDLAN
jgi:hypothetical protein